MKRPWFQMYTRDWLDNKELRRCAPLSRAILIDLMCLAHEGHPYGHLTDDIGQLTLQYMAARCFVDVPSFLVAVEDLISNQRLGRLPNGTLVVPRMIRDEDIRQRRAAGGSKGGNPLLTTPKSTKVNLAPNHQGYPRSESESVYAYPKGESEGGAKPRDPMQPPPGFEMFWSRYRLLRDAGRRRPAIAVWLTCGCERRSDAVLAALTSYERSRDAKNGAVQNADKWLQAVFDSGFSISWPAAEAEVADSRGNLPEWKGFTQ